MPKKAEKAKPMSRFSDYRMLRELTADNIVARGGADKKEEALHAVLRQHPMNDAFDFVLECLKYAENLTELELLIMCQANNLSLDLRDYQAQLEHGIAPKYDTLFSRVLQRLRVMRVLLDRRLADR